MRGPEGDCGMWDGGQEPADDFAIVEVETLGADNLCCLMSFAGDQHAVSRPCQLQRRVNSRFAVDDRAGLWSQGDATRQAVANDLFGIFGAGIVTGQDGEV